MKKRYFCQMNDLILLPKQMVSGREISEDLFMKNVWPNRIVLWIKEN